MSDRWRLTAEGLSASIAAAGAELVSLQDGQGREFLWQAGPEWRRHAPILFPIVGRLAGDTLRHGGQTYRLPQHGFARDRRFEWLEREASHCRLRLVEDAESLALFPFRFVLEQDFSLADGALTVATRIGNPGEETLPCAIGAHPAFAWPLAPGLAKTDHVLEFSAAETGVSHRLEGGLLGAPQPLPFSGTHLPLDPALFAEDALILPSVASRSLRYSVPGGPALTLSWDGYGDLGLWSKPEGADFLCIEPWCGMASPAGWDGAFSDKPGILRIPPGESRSFGWSVTLA